MGAKIQLPRVMGMEFRKFKKLENWEWNSTSGKQNRARAKLQIRNQELEAEFEKLMKQINRGNDVHGWAIEKLKNHGQFVWKRWIESERKNGPKVMRNIKCYCPLQAAQAAQY